MTATVPSAKFGVFYLANGMGPFASMDGGMSNTLLLFADLQSVNWM